MNLCKTRIEATSGYISQLSEEKGNAMKPGITPNPLLNPDDAILSEIEKAQRAPRRAVLLSFKTANDWVEEALNSPDGLYSNNPVMREVMKYISPQHWDKMDLLIRTFNLELISVTKTNRQISNSD